jgi:alpha-L-rhamnosidase
VGDRLLGETFGGEWIGTPFSGGTQNSSPLLCAQSFTLERPVVSARLYATALGLYEFSINGSASGDDVFTRAGRIYNTRVSITATTSPPAAKAGDNACGAILGDGWYCGHVEWRGRQRYGDRPQLRAQIGSLRGRRHGDHRHGCIVENRFGPILESDC